MKRSWWAQVDPVVRDWWPVMLVAVLMQVVAADGTWRGVPPLVPGLLGLAVAVPLRWRRERPLTVMVAVTVAVVVGVVLSSGTGPPFGMFVALMLCLRGRQRVADQLAGLVAALKHEKDEKALLAAEAERHRIAREVSDVVAHSLGSSPSTPKPRRRCWSEALQTSTGP